mgnify:CR=1 FL=1
MAQLKQASSANQEARMVQEKTSIYISVSFATNDGLQPSCKEGKIARGKGLAVQALLLV